jgi:hypothetical protein
MVSIFRVGEEANQVASSMFLRNVRLHGIISQKMAGLLLIVTAVRTSNTAFLLVFTV